MTAIWLDDARVDLAALAVLGQGGEADVYDLGDGRALKLYKRPDHPDLAGDAPRIAAAAARLAEIEAKLAAFPPGLPAAVIGPVAIARIGRRRDVAGYAMRKVTGAPMFELGEPRHRRGRAVELLAALVACFRHLHDTVSALHRAGVVIGDFNDGNVLVERDRCHLIDADSLQYARWRCAMFTDRYVDPRLCDRGAATPVLCQPHDEASDWFAFTTMLFRALAWVGPFGGVHQPADPKARVAPAARALRGPSVFGPDVIYPRAAVPLAGLPDALAAYFREVFDAGRRGRFPRALLDDVPLARCPRCAIDHARPQCPACRHAAPMVATTRAITAVEIDPRTVRRATWPVPIGMPAPSMLASGAFASGSPASGALASGAPAVWIAGGNLMRAGVLGPEPIGQIVPGASHAWVGPHLGAGWWRAGGYAVAFTFSPVRRGLDDRARLPALRGRIVEDGAILGDDRAWLWWREADAGRERVRVVCVAGGAVTASAEAPADDLDWLVGLGGACAAGPFLFVPTDQGIVRVEADGAGRLHASRRFADTAPLCTAADELRTDRDGLVVIKTGAPLALASGAARAVRLTFTARTAGQET